MTWTQLSQQISSISPADRGAMEAARRRWDAIAKPLRGLGRLEDLLVRMAGVTGSPDLDLGRKAVAVFCADNGVVAEGVTQTGQEVTWTVAQTMGERRSSVCHMARTAGAQVFPVDLGMVRRDTPPGVRPCVVLAGGTRNMTKGPAMPREAAERALAVGFSLARELAEDGDTLLAAGEMGIGNTTTTAAVACALLGLSPQEAVGRGAGLSDAGLARKRRAVERALEVNRPDPGDPVDILCKVGGLDIAAMTGFYLGCMLWAACIKDMDKPVLNNLCCGAEYNEKETVEEVDFIRKYLEQFEKDTKYYLAQAYKTEDFTLKILDEYEEFLKVNKGFTEVKNTSDIKLNKEMLPLSKEDRELILEKIADVVETGNFKELYPLNDKLFAKTAAV